MMTVRGCFPVCIGTVLIALIGLAGELHAQSTRHYIVKLQDEPVISHLMRQRPAGQPRIQLESAGASSYRAQLAVRQTAVMRLIEALPQAKVEAQMDTVFNGFVVSLRPEDLSSAKQQPGVEDVIPSIRYHKALDAAIPLINVPQAWTNPAVGGESNAGAGIKIAMLDTGIDINHPMLQDASLTPPAGFPLATLASQCPAGGIPVNDKQFTNSKVIVAKNYVNLLDNRDQNCDAEDRDGHGTFISGIAAGRRVNAPLASISGVAPKAFLASYKVFGTPGQNDFSSSGAIVKAVDDAVKDGMNIINLSLGTPTTDPLVEAAVANATNAGVTVVVAAGNDGPATGTVTSPGTSPAVITVGASSNARILANPLVLTANLPVPASLQKIGALTGTGPKPTASVGAAPLVDAITVDANGFACSTLPAGSLNGKIVLIRRGTCTFAVKVLNATNAGAIAALIFNNQPAQPPVPMDVGTSTNIPSAMIGNIEGLALVQFLASPDAGVQATLQAQQTAISTDPNRMAPFSASGPSTDLSIKPDLVAPGTTIYSAAQRNFPPGEQYDPSGFTISSGTSFSAPLVAGAAALIKQVNPGWTPAQIKSALVNTASNVIALPQGGSAGVLAEGSGLLNASAALSTPLLLSPVSVSFSSIGGAGPLSAVNINVRNPSPNADSFTVTVTPAAGNAAAVSVSPATFSLAPGASTTISVTASISAPIATIEGFLSIHGQTSQTSITVPYWGTLTRPSVNAGGVLNAASFSSGPLSVAAGSIISIFGSNLSNSTESAVTIPIPGSLGGATVMIGGHPAPLLFVSPVQINAQVPFEVEGSNSPTLTVNLNGSSSTPITLPLAPSAPGIFTVTQNGAGRGAILHAASGAAVTADNPARPGELLEVFATGLGAVTPDIPTGSQALSSPLSTTRITPTVTIAGADAPVEFAELAPGFVGLYQINVQVPSELPTGEQPLALTSNGVRSNSVTVSLGQ